MGRLLQNVMYSRNVMYARAIMYVYNVMYESFFRSGFLQRQKQVNKPYFVKGRVCPITRQQILESSKLKEFADDNFKFDKNGRKLSKQVENTVEKGEIARNEQFLLFHQCFQKVCFPEDSKGVIV